jgi:hypothetical protein
MAKLVTACHFLMHLSYDSWSLEMVILPKSWSSSKSLLVIVPCSLIP